MIGMAMWACAAFAQDAVELRSYPVRGLMGALVPAGREAPHVVLFPVGGGIPPSVFESGEVWLEDEELGEMVVELIEPAGWESEEWSLEYRGGALHVAAPRRVHDQVAAFLALLRRTASQTIHVQARFVEMPLEAAREWRGGDPTPLLSEAATVLAAVEVDVAPGARNFAAPMRSEDYVMDWTSNIAAQIVQRSPNMGTLMTGALLDVRAARAAVGDEILLDVRATWTAPGEMRVIEHPFPLQLPQVDVFRFGGCLRVAAGAWVVAGLSAQGDRARFLLLRATSSGVGHGASRLPAPGGAWALAAYDVSGVTFGVADYSMETANGQAYPSGGEEVDADSLLDWIRDAVEPESWEIEPEVRSYAAGPYLFVRHRASVLDQVDRLLSEAGRGGAGETTEIVTLDLMDEEAAAWMRENPGPELAPDAARAWIARGNVSTWAELSAQPSARAHVWSGVQSAYVRAYSGALAEGAGDLDPEIGVVNAGAGLDARVLRGEGGSHVEVAVRDDRLDELLRIAIEETYALEMPRTTSRLVRASAAVSTGAYRVIGADQVGGGALRVTLVRVR